MVCQRGTSGKQVGSNGGSEAIGATLGGESGAEAKGEQEAEVNAEVEGEVGGVPLTDRGMWFLCLGFTQQCVFSHNGVLHAQVCLSSPILSAMALFLNRSEGSTWSATIISGGALYSSARQRHIFFDFDFPFPFFFLPFHL